MVRLKDTKPDWLQKDTLRWKVLPPDLTGISTGLQERMIEFKGHLQEASKLFSEMLKKGISPNTVTFNTMMML